MQRILRQRRAAAERYRHLTAEQLIAEEIDPLLEKISRHGFQSLSRNERRNLLRAREKILEKTKRTTSCVSLRQTAYLFRSAA